MINTAYLRVYTLRQRGTREFRPHRSQAVIVRSDDRFVWHEPTTEDAFGVEWKGEAYLCPRFPRLRMLEGVLAFNRAYPGEALIPAEAVQRAADELAHLRNTEPAAQSHILSSPWHVPLRWFAAFDPDDRELYDAPFGLAVRYRTRLGTAADRIERSVRILEDAGFEEELVSQVRDLERWLDRFEPDAMLELDYATVAALFSDGDLVLDESAAEVGSSLAALAAGDFEQAGTNYAAVASRWAPAQSLTYVN